MRLEKALNIFKSDMKTIFTNPVVLIVLLAIILIPSLYAIVNIEANWDPYENTANLKIAVVNQDLGYSVNNENLNVGDMLVDELKENKTFNWEFVSYKEGMDGLNREKYYGIIIIPSNFSKSLLSIESLNPDRSEITFITNDKMNPIASRITDTSANNIQSAINTKVTRTIDDIIFNNLYDIGKIAKSNEKNFNNLKNFLNNLNSKTSSIGSYLSDGQHDMGVVSNIWSNVYKDLPQLKKDTYSLKNNYDNLYNQISSNPQKALSTVKLMESKITNTIQILKITDAYLNNLYNLTNNEDLKPIIKDVEEDLSIANKILTVLEDIEKNIDDVSHNKGNLVKLNSLINQLDKNVNILNDNKETINNKVNIASKGVDYANSNWPIAKNYIEEATAKINSINYDKLVQFSNANLSSIDNYFQSPVEVKEKKLYPIDNYGEGVAPFYICLALWVGCVITSAMVSTRFRPKSTFNPMNRSLNNNIQNFDSESIYVGRMGLFLVISILQSLIIIIGLLLLNLNISSTFLFIITTFYVGLCLMITIYSIISTLGNSGKAFVIVLLVFQIPATGGTYPIQLLPQFFQIIHSLLPLTYGIGAIREVMGGIYWSNYIYNIIILSIYPVVSFLITILIKEKLEKYTKLMEEKLDDSGLF